MKKRILAALLVLCMAVGLVACQSEKKTSAQSEGRPDDWNANAQVLKWLNGFAQIKTAEDLKPYVTSNTTKAQRENYIEQMGLMESNLQETAGEVQVSIGRPTYDQAEATLLETYQGYEVLYVKAWLSHEDEVMLSRSAVGMILLLKIENGKYVSTLKENFGKEMWEKYESCSGCVGSGTVSHTMLSCYQCMGMGVVTEYVCDDCGENFAGRMSSILTKDSEDPDSIFGFSENTTVSHVSDGEIAIPDNIITGIYTLDPVCPVCGGDKITEKDTVSCNDCNGEGATLLDPCEVCKDGIVSEHSCNICDGKGYIKH